jgi:hypothetical protein
MAPGTPSAGRAFTPGAPQEKFRDGLDMTERHLIAYAILLLLLIGAVALWRVARGPRRRRRAPEPHLRIDLIGDESEETLPTEP